MNNKYFKKYYNYLITFIVGCIAWLISCILRFQQREHTLQVLQPILHKRFVAWKQS